MTEDRRIGRPDRRVEVRWPEVDERRQSEGRRSDDVRMVLPNAPASILSMLAADPNLSPQMADVFADLAPQKNLEELAYEARMDPENRPFNPCRWAD